VREDPTRESLHDDESWQRPGDSLSLFEVGVKVEDEGKISANSFSGDERNRLFLGAKNNFTDATLVSGIDFRSDGRGFALLDFNDDNAIDIGLISNQKPRFRLLKNNLADSTPTGGAINIRLIGGNTLAASNSDFSSRDAIGAQVSVRIGEQTRIFQLGCGEGLSSQNSKRIHVGLGEAKKIDSLIVSWPNGRISTLGPVNAGTSLKINEKTQSSAK